MIELNPLVISHERTSVTETSKETYAITDKLSYFGVWDGKVTYSADFENTSDGLRTDVRAAMGLVSEGTWKVEERAEGLVLVETARVSCGRLMRLFVEGTMRKSHNELCGRFLERLQKARVEERDG